MKNILFRVDSGGVIGAGHIMRCLALAARFSSSAYNVYFLMRGHLGNLGREVERLGYQAHYLSPAYEPKVDDYLSWVGASQSDDANECSRFINNIGGVELLVVDHYGLDREWEEYFQEYTTLVIDDLASRVHACDFLLDQTPNRSSEDYSVSDVGQLLLGERYALIRDEFIQGCDLNGSDDWLLLALGAADAGNATGHVLDLLKGWHGKISVLLGSSAPHMANLKLNYGDKIDWCISPNSVADVYSRAKVVISTPSVSALERCAMGIPSILVKTASNQESMRKSLSELGVAYDVGDIGSLSVADLRAGIGYVLDNWGYMSSSCQDLCDGVGAFRCIKKLGFDEVCIRPAEKSDCRLIYQWQLQPGMRAHFRNPNIPSYQEHRVWFDEKINEESSLIFIVIFQNFPCGVVRLDSTDELACRQSEVSILVDKRFHGLGVAKRSLKLLEQYARKNCICDELYAEVNENNKVSETLFLSVGYDKDKFGGFRFSVA